MVNRIDEMFIKLREQKQKALIAYFTAGDPSIEMMGDIVQAIEKGGADLIEIGVPYSDPLADGPVIQKAAERALQKGLKINHIFEAVKEVRKTTEVPLVFLVYYNSIFRYGEERFLERCIECGIDGLIIPDLPLEERAEFMEMLKGTPVALIPLVSPVSKQRIGSIVEGTNGFVYCISSLGVTGVRDKFEVNVQAFMEEVSSYTDMPLALGFGIGSPEAVRNLKPYADAVIVGSAIVRKIEALGKGEENLAGVEGFVRELSEALKEN